MLALLPVSLLAALVPAVAPGGALSFLALGDWGGLPEPPFVTPRQVAVAGAMGRAVTELGGDFVLALGDNFYYEGVRDEWDPRFQVSPGDTWDGQVRHGHRGCREPKGVWGPPDVPGDPQRCPGTPRSLRGSPGGVPQVRPPPDPPFPPQYLEEGGVGYILSGAGNFMEDSRPHEGSVPPGALRFFFGSPASPGGFAHVRLEPRAATVTFLEATGRVLHRVTLPPRQL
ncbi:tartrate-resistant acid phosphatase type 5 [Pyrgilauda ruficollis]|uniref:tartrate-resistant acid phosphatase type 5 n=1 Tax=Pyrgilauda ruficollis TaxID=221976 RepID=UPI001B87D466|nr:tartrate-resistant acid phosphatase type 5 [Pyrgilauda ruficollis]